MANKTPATNAKLASLMIRDATSGRYLIQARTVSFSDLARGSRIFVKIHGYDYQTADISWGELEVIAKANGFSIQAV